MYRRWLPEEYKECNHYSDQGDVTEGVRFCFQHVHHATNVVADKLSHVRRVLPLRELLLETAHIQVNDMLLQDQVRCDTSCDMPTTSVG
ncbi:hypothetical protein V6N13_024960 [Hibiscus sabdariffa]|uniref:RNase H type-1 domain-containing protein n=2 Tax=Hibiscus sabdariffa TaxID=183260 RepID=A0ABR2BIM3_9ROSI